MLEFAFGVGLAMHVAGSLTEEAAADSYCHAFELRLRRGVSPEHAAHLARDAASCEPRIQQEAARRAGTSRSDARTDAVARVPTPARETRPTTNQRPDRTRYADTSRTRMPGPRTGEGERFVPRTEPRTSRREPELPQPESRASQPDPRPIDPTLPPNVTYRGQTYAREFPSQSRCESPEGGWIGLVETMAPDRQVTFDGGPPQNRTSPPGTVPDLMHVLTFSTERPAYVFTEPVPCYIADAGLCDASHRSGRFVVTGRVRYNAGPHGTARWQLCLRREGEIAT